MTRYYFDVTLADQTPLLDDEGLDLPSIERARVEAIRALTDIAKEFGETDSQTNQITVTVRDVTGPVMHTTIKLELKRLR